MSNLDLWNQVEKTDPNFTKQFNRSGGFKGTGTSATYLVKKATKTFGPIGIGWGFDLVDEEMLEGALGTKVHKVRIKLWYKWNGERGEVTSFGQTEFISKRTSGLYTDEEAPKKSLTDALSKALSWIGFAGDIHLGLYDDSKYFNDVRREFRDADEFGEVLSIKANESRQLPPPRQTGGDQPQDPQQGQQQPEAAAEEESFEVRVKAAIDGKKTYDEVIALMTHKKTQAELKKLDKADADAIRAYGQARMKELGWMSPKETAQAAQATEAAPAEPAPAEG